MGLLDRGRIAPTAFAREVDDDQAVSLVRSTTGS
jgi:hypothetical protein